MDWERYAQGPNPYNIQYSPDPEEDARIKRGKAEAALSIGTSIASEVPAGLAGVVSALKPAYARGGRTRGEEAYKAIEDTQEALTYQPRSEEGQRDLMAVATALEPVAEWATKHLRDPYESVMNPIVGPVAAGALWATMAAMSEVTPVGRATPDTPRLRLNPDSPLLEGGNIDYQTIYDAALARTVLNNEPGAAARGMREADLLDTPAMLREQAGDVVEGNPQPLGYFLRDQAGAIGGREKLRVNTQRLSSGKENAMRRETSAGSVEVLKNPTQADLNRLSGRDGQPVRFVVDKDQNIYVWPAEKLHDQVLPELGLEGDFDRWTDYTVEADELYDELNNLEAMGEFEGEFAAIRPGIMEQAPRSRLVPNGDQYVNRPDFRDTAQDIRYDLSRYTDDADQKAGYALINDLNRDSELAVVGAQTRMDKLFAGSDNGKYTAQEAYDAYRPVREKLRQQYGDYIELQRVNDVSADTVDGKTTLRWALPEDSAEHWQPFYERELAEGKRQVETRRIPVDDIALVNTGPNGDYPAEFIVLNRDDPKLTDIKTDPKPEKRKLGEINRRQRGAIGAKAKQPDDGSVVVELPVMAIAGDVAKRYRTTETLSPKKVKAIRDDFSGEIREPIKMTINEKGEVDLTDGRHRLAVAVAEGVETIPVRLSKAEKGRLVGTHASEKPVTEIRGDQPLYFAGPGGSETYNRNSIQLLTEREGAQRATAMTEDLRGVYFDEPADPVNAMRGFAAQYSDYSPESMRAGIIEGDDPVNAIGAIVDPNQARIGGATTRDDFVNALKFEDGADPQQVMHGVSSIKVDAKPEVNAKAFGELNMKTKRDQNLFGQALSEARQKMDPRDAAQVDPMPENFKGEAFLTSDGMAGFLIDENGTLINLFRHPDAPYGGVMGAALTKARGAGAKNLEAFDTYLARGYINRGAVETWRAPWDPSQASEAVRNALGDRRPDYVGMDIGGVLREQQFSEILGEVAQEPLERWVGKGVPKAVKKHVTEERKAMYRQAIEAGLEAGGERWYWLGHLLDKFMIELGPELGQQRFKEFMIQNTGMSARSGVDDQIKRASVIYQRHVNGQSIDLAQPPGSQTNPDLENPITPHMPPGYGHLAHQNHMANIQRAMREGGYDPIQQPKYASYLQNYMGNERPGTMDTHINVLLSGKGPKGVGNVDASGGSPGYKALEDISYDISQEYGLTGAGGQAAAWVGGGDLGWLNVRDTRSMAKQFNKRIAKTAEELEIPEEEALVRFIMGDTKLYAAMAGLFGIEMFRRLEEQSGQAESGNET